MFYNETFQSPFSKGYDLTQLISYYYFHLFPGWCVSWIPQPIILSLFLYYMHWGINYERVKKNYKDRFSKRYIKSFGKNEKPYMINLLHHQTSDPSLHRQNRKNRALFRFVSFVWIWLDSHGLSKAIVFVFFFFWNTAIVFVIINLSLIHL